MPLPVPRRPSFELAPYWFSAPTSWFHHLVVFVRRGRTRFDTCSGLLPELRLGFRVWPGLPRAIDDACALSRFFPHQHYPVNRSHRSRAYLARVMLRPRAYSAPRRVAPPSTCLDSFIQVRSRGFPFRALPRMDRLASRRDIPSCDSPFHAESRSGEPDRVIASRVI